MRLPKSQVEQPYFYSLVRLHRKYKWYHGLLACTHELLGDRIESMKRGEQRFKASEGAKKTAGTQAPRITLDLGDLSRFSTQSTGEERKGDTPKKGTEDTPEKGAGDTVELK